MNFLSGAEISSVCVVRFIEGPYYKDYFYKECIGIFLGPSELSVLKVESVLERCP